MEVPVQEPKKRIVSRRSFLKAAGGALVGFPLYAGEISRHEISVERHTIRLKRLPEAFHGFRIIQLSDFHYAEFTEPYFIRDVVKQANHLKPDMVVLNGDYVTDGALFSHTQTKHFAYRCTEILAEIECSRRYAVLGNHDSTFAKHAVIDGLAQHKHTLLNNRYEPLERDGKRLWIAGTGDALTNDTRLDEAVPPSAHKDKEPVLMIIHEPDLLPMVARHDADLMLSGHTHGGQIRFPFVPAMHLPPLGKKYVEGLFRLGSTKLYVTRGVGTVKLPFRFNCPPEITLLTLEAGDGD